MSVFDYKSLEMLPNLQRDQYGNLNLLGENIGYFGLYPRVRYLLSPKLQLDGTVLVELLEWLRWGSENSVRWDCTLGELIQIIEKWLKANPDAPKEQYSPYITTDVDWAQLWNTRGMKDCVHIRTRCKCGLIFSEFDFECQACWQKWHEMERVRIGPRGEGTYNLVLKGDGGSVAAAVWTNRNWLFLIPQEFEKMNNLYAPTYSPSLTLLDL